ncbi:MAG: DUF1592 domain-containing protein [Prosthecobacter sp.]
MIRPSPLSGLLALSAGLSVHAAAALPPPVATFIDQHCIECHDADVSKGDLDLSALGFDLKDPHAFQSWQKVFERVRDGEMPPKKKPQPEAAEKETFLTGLKTPLVKVESDYLAANGRVRSRRLTRTEYENTLHDLLGIDIPLKTLLPEDRASYGFETVADGQQMSQHLLARYLDVADIALTEAFDRALKPEKPFQRHLTPQDLAKRSNGNYRGPDLRDGKSISWPIKLQFFGRMPATTVRDDGWYRITLRDVHAINPGADGVVWGTLRSGECSSAAPMLFLVGLVEATAKPRDMVFETWIQGGHMLELKPNDNTLKPAPSGATGGNVSFAGRDLTRQGFEGIANSGIDIERIHPTSDRATVVKRLFDDMGPEAIKPENLERLVTRFARRAFRRPVTDEQINPYREIARQSLAGGDPLPEALRVAYRAILCSPRFLTFIEEPGALDDHAIASRLSYALWVSMPDYTLIQLANEKKLSDPKVLAEQVDRMLAHPKARRFIESFTDQWLKLKEIDFTTPDTRQYPQFDVVVQESMLQETRAYFAELIQKNLSITNLVDSDFAFLNERLARHYAGGIQTGAPSDKGKKQKDKAIPVSLPDRFMVSDLAAGEGLQKVKLDPNSKRGGLVTQGAVLKVTADGTSTSPVVRGVFINERILGEHIPPPPPGVPAIEPDIRGATSIRDQLDKHRNNESCASCHQTIDPPGFVLENYDPVGVWRSGYGKGGRGAKVDPSGSTPDGGTFANLTEWKRIYSERADQLARGFATHFLTYATGGPLRLSNETALEQVVSSTEENRHGMRSLIQAAVKSEIFLSK